MVGRVVHVKPSHRRPAGPSHMFVVKHFGLKGRERQVTQTQSLF